MTLISLEKAKQHLRVDDGHSDGDITDKLSAAVIYAQEYMQRKIYADQAALDDANDEFGIATNALIEAGILLILGQLYAYRETSHDGQVSDLPLTARSLLDPYRIKLGV